MQENNYNLDNNMQKNNKNIILVIVLVAVIVIVIGGAVALYAFFGVNTKVPQVNTTQSTISNTEQENETISAPDITIYNQNGKEVSLSQFIGKPIVINFWASWCGPCKQEMPHFDEMYQKYSDEVEFIMVNMTGGGNDTKENADKFIQDGGYTFPVYYDNDLDGAIQYGVSAMPTTYFIDENGNVVNGYRGAITKETLQTQVDYLLS